MNIDFYYDNSMFNLYFLFLQSQNVMKLCSSFVSRYFKSISKLNRQVNDANNYLNNVLWIKLWNKTVVGVFKSYQLHYDFTEFWH